MESSPKFCQYVGCQTYLSLFLKDVSPCLPPGLLKYTLGKLEEVQWKTCYVADVSNSDTQFPKLI